MQRAQVVPRAPQLEPGARLAFHLPSAAERLASKLLQVDLRAGEVDAVAHLGTKIDAERPVDFAAVNRRVQAGENQGVLRQLQLALHIAEDLRAERHLIEVEAALGIEIDAVM